MESLIDKIDGPELKETLIMTMEVKVVSSEGDNNLDLIADTGIETNQGKNVPEIRSEDALTDNVPDNSTPIKRNRKRKRKSLPDNALPTKLPTMDTENTPTRRRHRRRRRRKPEVPPLFPELLQNLPGLPQRGNDLAKEETNKQATPSRCNGPEDLLGKVKRRVFDEEGNVVQLEHFTDEELSSYGILLNFNGKRPFTGDNRKRNKFLKSQGSCGVTGILSTSHALEEDHFEEDVSTETVYDDAKKLRRVERAQKRRGESTTRREILPPVREKSLYVTQIRTTEENIALFTQHTLLDLYELGVFDIQTGQPAVKPAPSESEPVADLLPSEENPMAPSPSPEQSSDIPSIELRVPLDRPPQSGDTLLFKILELDMEVCQPTLSDFKMFLVENYDEKEKLVEGIYSTAQSKNEENLSSEKMVLNLDELVDIHLLMSHE